MTNWYKISQEQKRNPRQQHTSISDETKNKAIRMYKAKEDGGEQINMKDVSSLLNLSTDHIRKILKNNKIPIRKKNNLTPSQEQNIFQLYKDPKDGGKGMNYVQISKYMGNVVTPEITRAVVKKIAEEKGYPLRENPFAKKEISPETKSKIINLWNQGIGITKLVETFKLPRNSIYKMFDEQKIPYKKQMKVFNPPPNTAAYLVQLFEKGNSLASIADIFNVNTSTISWWLEKNGYRQKEISSRDKFINEAPLIGYMYVSTEEGGLGMTMAEIAKDLGINIGSVITALKRMNITSRSNRLQFSKEETEKIISLYNSGKSAREIGKQMGISSKPIEKLLFREQNITPRTKSETKTNWWANYPGGFEAYLNQYPKEKQQQILNAIQYKQQQPIVSSNLNWFKKSIYLPTFIFS
jgi:DNA-binding CsgD family transcriptional regulator